MRLDYPRVSPGVARNKKGPRTRFGSGPGEDLIRRQMAGKGFAVHA